MRKKVAKAKKIIKNRKCYDNSKPVKKIYYPVATDYLRKIYSNQEFIKLINKLSLKIAPFVKKHKIDAIAFTGTSGAAVAYPLSYKLKIPLICIRKGFSHYSGGYYEGRTDIQKYIIVDDFIETGATIKRIKKQVKLHSPKAKLIGIFLYSGSVSRPYQDRGVWMINV